MLLLLLLNSGWYSVVTDGRGIFRFLGCEGPRLVLHSSLNGKRIGWVRDHNHEHFFEGVLT